MVPWLEVYPDQEKAHLLFEGFASVFKLPGSFWLIHQLSYPKGCSLNDKIDESLLSVSYASFYFDKCFPMGCSCSYFESFSTFQEWVLFFSLGVDSSVHYLNYFLFIGPAGSQLCNYLFKFFQLFCKYF